MSRSGYIEADEHTGQWQFALGLAQVRNAIRSARGQAFLRELAAALDAMPEKQLFAGAFQTQVGEHCALGAVARVRGTRVDDLGTGDDVDPLNVGARFGISKTLAAEVMEINDEWLMNKSSPEHRWRVVRDWAAEMTGEIRS